MRYFRKDTPNLCFAMPDTKLFVSGICTLFLSVVSYAFKAVLQIMPVDNEHLKYLVKWLTSLFVKVSITFLVISIILTIIAVIVHFAMPDKSRIKHMVRKGLYCYEFGNPLHLKDGERLPKIKCVTTELGVFKLTVKAVSCTVEDIQNISSSISSALSRKGLLLNSL